MIECNKSNCNQRYIGETSQKLRVRFLQHKRYVENVFSTQATGVHFNMPGHSSSNMTVTIIEKVKSSDEMYRKEREQYHIRKFKTYYHGINRMP